MKRTYIADLKKGKSVVLYGFIQESRILSRVAFIELRDVSGIVQCVVKKEDEDLYKTVKKVNRESVVSISGIVKENKKAKGGVEVEVNKIDILSEAEAPLPIPVVEKGNVKTNLSKRLDWRFLDLRKRKNLLIMKASSVFEKGIREYWSKNNYIEIHSPKFMGAPSESGSELFMVPYFGKEAFLAQSPQFYKQMAMAAGFERVFEIGPVFRAEPSHTTRHTTEFVSIDVEISYISSHHDVMDEEAKMIKHGLEFVKKELGSEIKEVFGFEIEVPKLPFPKVTMEEAYSILKEMGYKVKIGDDLDPEHEKALCKWAKEKHGSDFVFVYDWPTHLRPFYHMRSDDGKTTKSFDLLYKGVEITSGAQREHRADVLIEQVVEKGINPKSPSMRDYINFFRYGCPPHGGFGLGLARFVEKMLNLDNIREATYLPRDTDRLTP